MYKLSCQGKKMIFLLVEPLLKQFLKNSPNFWYFFLHSVIAVADIFYANKKYFPRVLAISTF
jgi:hypothetical protein